MAVGSKGSRKEQAALKFSWIPLTGLSDVRKEENDSNKQTDKPPSQPKSPEFLTTTQLVSAVGKVWDCANRPLPVFQVKSSVKHNETSFCQNENALFCTGWERNGDASTSYSDNFRIDPKCAKRHYDMVNSIFDIAQKTSSMELCSRLSSHSLFRRYVQFDDSYRFVESWKVNGINSLSVSFDIGKFYERIQLKPLFGPKYHVHMSQIECKKPSEIRNETTPDDNLAIGCTDCRTNDAKFDDTQLVNNGESVLSSKLSLTSLYSDKFLGSVTYMKAKNVFSRIQSSKYNAGVLDLDDCTISESKSTVKKENMLRTKESLIVDVPAKEQCLVTSSKPKYALANQRHALAGAFSGTFVSLCLHPVDTIKTVIQSHGVAEKSIFQVVRSVVSDRGVTGLYRGIASNIACSAPISAIYTYTYESVKGALLPVLPKEYYSVAHCVAGGCASVATSFIFTPSERIKQQMQVSSHYHNCWAAMVGILGKGGLTSLYAGWGAVLCRNIPHSIIKFYTYETLKQLLFSSEQSTARPSTYQTLLCGGIAGSTAALFTTPFDVVKTRLQTQIPGSLRSYDGVLHALKEIYKNEGLKGLYRYQLTLLDILSFSIDKVA
ncbi:hypothetical protein IFM89_037708 [Coptis chinensis]|uniref:Mitochondrial substrate carrier family protein n=1 Tax=Coptis chinensis TaxID=261450 RepID=A0A835IET8_9MAGN|nr:hypothetical protein IFM89_037708 [Coptis chinensis]